MDVLPGGVVFERHLGALFVGNRWRYAVFQRLSSQSGRIASIRQATRCRILVWGDYISFFQQPDNQSSVAAQQRVQTARLREAAARVPSPPAEGRHAEARRAEQILSGTTRCWSSLLAGP